MKAVEHRLQPGLVRVSVVAERSEDNPATANPARRLPVEVPAKREARKSVDNREPTGLQPRRLLVRVRVKREVEEREGRAHMVNLAARQKAERQLRVNRGKGNQSAERKRARGPHRHEGHNNFLS